MTSVFVCGLSMPDSMMVVATSTSISPGRERLHDALELLLGHLPVRDADARLGHESAARARERIARCVMTRLKT